MTKLLGENYNKITGQKQFVPVADIRSDTISFEQILLQKLTGLDNRFSEASESLNKKKIRRLKTELENFNGWVITLGTDAKRADFYDRILPLKIEIAGLWGQGEDPIRANRWELFLAMKDYFSVLKIYSMSYGRILPHDNKVLLVGKGVFDEEYLLKHIGEMKPTKLKKAFGVESSNGQAKT